MQLSTSTLKILKNFASINGNLVVDAGNVIKTISVSKSVLAKATVAESFPTKFGIYDLNEFLSVMNLVESPSFDFGENSVLISSTNGGSSVQYYYSDPEILTSPQKDVKMPESQLTLTLNTDDLSKLIKAASVLGHTELSFKSSDGQVIACINDGKNQTANTYTLKMDATTDNDFSLDISISNLNLIQGNYQVHFSNKGISHWKSDTVEYYIALEKTSTFK